MDKKLVSVNILTNNPKQLANFYQTVLGANVDESHGGPNRIEIWFGEKSNDTVIIVANYSEKNDKQNTNCLKGFELRVKNADAEYKRIQNLGIEIKEQPKDLPWGYRYFSITDPDGNEIDIVEKLNLGC